MYSGPMSFRGIPLTVTGSGDVLRAVVAGGVSILPLLSSAARLELRMACAAAVTADTCAELFTESELTGQVDLFDYANKEDNPPEEEPERIEPGTVLIDAYAHAGRGE